MGVEQNKIIDFVKAVYAENPKLTRLRSSVFNGFPIVGRYGVDFESALPGLITNIL